MSPPSLTQIRLLQTLTRSLSLTQFWICRWGVQNWPVIVTSLFLMSDGSLERKGSSENRNAVWKTSN